VTDVLTFKVLSASGNGEYDVRRSETGFWSCTCRGFGFRRVCAHIDHMRAEVETGEIDHKRSSKRMVINFRQNAGRFEDFEDIEDAKLRARKLMDEDTKITTVMLSAYDTVMREDIVTSKIENHTGWHVKILFWRDETGKVRMQ